VKSIVGSLTCLPAKAATGPLFLPNSNSQSFSVQLKP